MAGTRNPWEENYGSNDGQDTGAKPWEQAYQQPEAPKSRTLGAVANDTVIEVANAAAGGVSSAANFIKPGNAVSGWIDKNIVKAGEDSQSDVTKAAKQQFRDEVENADGVMGELGAVGKYVVQNPLLSAAQAAGSFVGPGLAVKAAGFAGKAAQLGAKGVERAGRAGGVAAGAAMAGGDAAGTAYELSRKAGATEDQAVDAGRQASVIPAIVGGVSGMFGAERLLAGAKGFSGGAASRALKTGASEAAQEGFEEGVTQYEGQRAAMPYDASIDPSKGVAAAAGMGAALGGITGAGTSLLTGGNAAQPGPSQQTPPPAPANSPATGPTLALPAPDRGVIQVGGDGTARTPAYQKPSFAGDYADVTDVVPRALAPQPADPVRAAVESAANSGGALSGAALVAIDSGVTPPQEGAFEDVQELGAQPPQVNLDDIADPYDRAYYESLFDDDPAPLGAPPVLSAFLQDDDNIPDFDAANNVSEEDFLRALGADEQEIQDAIATTPHRAESAPEGAALPAGPQANVTAGTPEGAGAGAAQPAGPVTDAPTNLRDALARVRAQKQEAANAQAATPQAAPAAAAVPAAGPGAVEAAGSATTSTTTGVASEPQTDQTQQASTQPAQAGAAQPPTAGLTDAAPAENIGAQAAPAPGAQAAPEAETREQRAQRIASAGEAWTRMPTVERQALAQRTDLKPVARKNVHSAAWENLNGDIQHKLADAIYPQNQPAALVQKAQEATKKIANVQEATAAQPATATLAADPAGPAAATAAEPTPQATIQMSATSPKLVEESPEAFADQALAATKLEAYAPAQEHRAAPAAAAPKKPRGVLAKKAEAEAKARADYFTPGNIVQGYSGHDRVIAYQPAGGDGQWSVTVRAVEKQGNAWVDKAGERERVHGTQPDSKALKAGPVARGSAIDAQDVTKTIAEPGEQDAGTASAGGAGQLEGGDAAQPVPAVRADGAGNEAAQTEAQDGRNAFTLKRMNQVTGKMEPVTFERGEYVRHKLGHGEIDGISQARSEFRVDGVWQPFGFAYKAERPAAPNADTVPLSKVIDKMNAKHGAGLTDADRVPAPSTTPKTDAHAATMQAVRDGKTTPERLQESFDAVVANADAIKAELSTKTKAELLRVGGPFVQMRYANEKKADVVDAVYREILGEYALGESVTYGMGRDSFQNAVRKLVEATDADKLAQYVTDRQAAAEQAQASRAARAEALENPKTLDDFRNLLNAHIRTGKTRKEAFLMLAPEQRIKYDTLEAESTREARETRKRTQKTQVRAAGQTTAGEIVAAKHTRDGYDLFVVKLADRLNADDYKTVLASAKKLGGWYSAFRGNGAIPGFQFKDKTNAEAFLALAGGDTTAAQEQVAQRRDAFEDDRSQTAVERLRAMADKMEAQAKEAEGRDRKANTERRARFASAALQAAAADKAKAQTMRNIAQAIEDGKARFLDDVRTKSQVDMLNGTVDTAKGAELRAKYPSYADQEKHKGEPPTAETADFADFPSYSAFRSDLATLGRQMMEVDGTKKLGQRLLSVADDVTDSYLDFAKANFRDVSQFGRGDSLADFASKDEAERAIKRSGLTGKAIVLPIKRGQNRVILSPGEAIGRGVWKGDGDKRITLTAEFGAEMVEAIGRRGNKQNQLAVPWQFQTAYDRRKALARIGIETPSEFRAALREYIDLKEQAVANRTRAMELQMVGRKADGLDFFPTSAEVADQMIEAADLSPDMSVLEPSAGMGHLADRIREAGAEPDVIEISSERRALLEEKGYTTQDVDDFLDLKPREFFTFGDTFRAPDGAEGIMRGANGNRVRLVNDAGDMVGAGYYDRAELTGVTHNGTASGYDRIIMNPPFSNRRDAEHVRHAYSLLKPGGRIVAIMGEGVFFGNDKKAQEFREWLESVGGTSEKLPDGSFLDPSLPVTTGANARMVVIDKAEGAAMFSRTPATKAAYEARIDALYAGGKPLPHGVRVLDRSDMLGLLGMGSGPVHLVESKVEKGRFNHGLSAADWKKVPGWLDDPAMVFDSETQPGRLVFIAPEMVNGSPVRMIVDPRPDGQGVNLLVNAYDADRNPFQRWERDGLMRYFDQQKAPSVTGSFQPRLTGLPGDRGRNKILTEKHLGGYRRANTPAAFMGQSAPPADSNARNVATLLLVDGLKAKWTRAPEIIVARNMQDTQIPQAVRDYDATLKSQGASGEARGFIYKGKVYLLSDQLKGPQQIAEVLFHEVLGHYGLRGVFGKGLDSILQQMSTMRRKEVVAKAREYGLFDSDALGGLDKKAASDAQIWAAMSPKDRLSAAEEVLAEMAQTQPNIGFVQRAIAAIRNWLRAHVPGFERMRLTDADIVQAYILPARGYVTRSNETAQQAIDRAMLAFSRSPGNAQTMTDEQARQNGFTLKAYRGISKSNPFNDSGTTWLTTSREVAEAYAEEVMGYGDPGVLEVMVKPDGLPRHDASRLTDEQREAFGADEFGNPQSMGIYDRSDDHPLGGSRGNVTVIHAPREAVVVLGSNAPAGDFDPDTADIRFSRAAVSGMASKARDELNRTFTAPGKLSWWHKTVGTMYNLAERSPVFKRVFDSAQGFVDDVSHYATDAAELAPKLLPKLETWRDIAKRPISAADNAAVAKPVFEGTLDWARDESGKPVRLQTLLDAAEKLTPEQKAQRLLRQNKISEGMLKAWQGLPLEQYEKLVASRYESQMLKAGIVWTPAELKAQFKLTDAQVELYQEFRAATDRSLDTMARSDMLRFGGEDVKDLADMVMDAASAQDAAQILRDHLLILAKENPDRAGAIGQLANGMLDRAARVQELQEQGYAPLSRFGKYTVDVVDAGGERQYFGLFETAREANIMAMKMRKGFGQDAVTQGTLSDEEFKLLAGITPESLELFGNMLGLDATGDDAQDQAFQEYLRRTKTNRSAMRRLIHRQGIAGYSEDVGRVLASFIYSNARQTSAGLHMGDLGEAITAIPKQQGELKDAAIQLSEYVKNPQEEAQMVRGLLFAQYLGGSIASAVVNMTQPVAVSFPWLSQFGGAKQAAAELGRAAKNLASRGHRYEADLAAALKLAEEEGTVSPQEVHQLMAQARGSGSLRPGDGTRAGDARAAAGNALTRLSLGWGKVFGAAEQVNRRMTFIAAYRVAKAQGMANPAAFAKKAVVETQFVYSKANKMKWGRGAVGATVMTFKTYSIAYIELLHRMYTQGGPEGKQAVLLALAVLMLMGGAGGLPFAEDAEDLVDGLAQMMGYNFNSKKAKQELLESVFGEAGAGFVERGITGLPGMPLDVSGRLGMGNLLPGTGIFKEKTDHTRDVLELVGPVGDLAKRVASGGRAILTGDVGAGLLQVSPVAVRNAAKGADMAARGMYRDDKGYKVIDTTPTEAAMKAIGFQPASVAKVQEANFINQQAKNFYSMQANEIRALWARGIFEQNQDLVEDARARVEDWNRKNPDQRMVIAMPAVFKRVREMFKTKDQRIADTAPKAMRQALREESARARAAQ